VPLPPPDITTGRRGLQATLDATFKRGALGATLALSGSAVREVRVDHVTGRRTLFLERDDRTALALSAGAVGGRGEHDVLERLGVTLDRDGRPVDLVVWRQGELKVSADLPLRLQAVAGLLSTPTKGGRIWVQETHLDLTEAANLAVARADLAASGDARAAARALAARLDAVGVEHVRTMALQSTRIGAGGTFSAGLRLGGSVDRTTIHQRLLDAATRGIDGVWRRRADCLATA
jgi:hypothetical protein